MSGARGPVLIEVPEDVWVEAAEVDLDSMVLEAEAPPPLKEDDVRAAIDMLSAAKLPLVLAGGGIAYAGASSELVKFAERLGVPVATTGNGRGVISETHPLSLGRAGFGGGNLIADKALERADALLCVGCGISDMTTYEFTLPLGMDNIMVASISGYMAPQAPPARVSLCDAAEFLTAANTMQVDKSGTAEAWTETLADARATWAMMLDGALARPGDLPSGARLARGLAASLPADAVVCVGAGTHLLYAMDFMPCTEPLTFMSTVNFGSMGFGFAANLAAKAIDPERASIAMLGDGDFAMTLQDLETAVREGLGVKVFVMNDSTACSTSGRSSRSPGASTAPNTATPTSPSSPGRSGRRATGSTARSSSRRCWTPRSQRRALW
jgi:acetolactate synthase-1/2/3 large subunit